MHTILCEAVYVTWFFVSFAHNMHVVYGWCSRWLLTSSR